VTRLVREFLRRTPGPYCIDCLAAKLSLPTIEARVALGELGNELPATEGAFHVADGTCAACGKSRMTAAFRPKPFDPGAALSCSWCHDPLAAGDVVAALQDGRIVRVHMRCLRAFRAGRFDLQ
jgi:hypothetical protein